MAQTPAQKFGIMICGHGSRDQQATDEFSLVAKALKIRYPNTPIAYGFLEYCAPNIHMGLDKLLTQGVRDIYAIPGMLLAATHAKNDIPSVLTTFAHKHPYINMHYGEELGVNERMIDAIVARIQESLPQDTENLHDTMLVVVGRGTSDATANGDIAKITRIVNERMGFGWADCVYSGVTYPATGIGLEMLTKLGFKRIVVMPYFLFTGRLIKRVTNYVNEVAEKYPHIQFIQTPYLKNHPKVIDMFQSRIQDLMDPPQKNQGLMADFKHRLALGQVDIHHHHAEYQENPHQETPYQKKPLDETDEAYGHPHDAHGNHIDSHGNIMDKEHAHHSHTHTHTHTQAHTQAHTHTPYKHIDHPMGPRTMIGTKNCCCFMGQFPQHIIDEELAKLV